ncbi:MAG: helix-turn-helix domain-containing protein [Leptospiraceae bacterium]|nr:helix-turn-helix domain-containing protein [Leptospiraceae bacterium]MCZ8345827.1 helix-turn-helix domain-containing protein [Leptospiraceae bacterium]
MIGNIIISGALLQCFVVSYFFLQSDKIGRNGKYLSLFFLLNSILMFINLLVYNEALDKYPHFIKLGFLFAFLVAPLFMIAIEKYFGLPFENKFFIALSFIPFLSLLIYQLPFYLSSSQAKLVYLSQIKNPHQELERRILFTLTFVFNALVLLRIYIRFRHLSEEFSKDNFKEQEKFQKNLIVLILWLLASISFALIFDIEIAENLSSLGFALWMIAFAWQRVYLDQSELSQETKQSLTDPEKYKKSFLNEDKVNELGLKINSLLSQDEILLDSELTLPKLANEMNLSNHICSQVINRYFDKSFLELLREKRIYKSLELLKNTDLPILRICYDSGFNSKNSFIRAFREVTGKTPSEYKKET